MTEPSSNQVTEGARAIVNNARRLGLIWDLTLATVSPVSNPNTGSDSVQVTCDGDTVPVGALTMIGPVVAGDRVYVIQVPPGGNYIVGLSDRPGDRFASVSTAGSLASDAGGGEAAVPAGSWTVGGINYEADFIFAPGHIYKLIISGAILPSGFPGACIVRVRKGSASTSGTQLIYFEKDWATTGGIELTHIGWIKNADGAALTTNLSLTVQRVTATTIALYGDSSRPMVLSSEDAGLISKQPGLAAIATAI